MNRYEIMSSEKLRKLYVPDVYQKNVYDIKYHRLKAAGIRLISFDVDDTIAMMEEAVPPEETVALFRNLKAMGFYLVLMSNNKSLMRADIFSQALHTDYISDAGKPFASGFEGCRNLYYLKYHAHLTPNQMAHIGNNLINDIGGGNAFGTVTCLVRRMGELAKIFHPPFTSETHELRKVLKERGIWYKHHVHDPDDQYYQLGEIPAYRRYI
ncbi:MAG: hypothetical protein E7496_10030 [Ruminococcus sp.]|nr:hypothetical protein [Ruminococcus sp.]MBR4320641.1 HAD hydrolase-like protein [Oscillospiraceae bacterium]